MTSAIGDKVVFDSKGPRKAAGNTPHTGGHGTGAAPAHSQQPLVNLLCALAATANEAGTPQEAMQTSLRLVCEHTGWALGRLVMFAEPPLERKVAFSLWYMSHAGAFEEFMTASKNPRYSTSGGRFLTAILRDQRPVWLEDLAQEGDFGRKAVALKAGLHCAFGFPVIVGQDTFRTIVAGQPSAFIAEIPALL